MKHLIEPKPFLYVYKENYLNKQKKNCEKY